MKEININGNIYKHDKYGEFIVLKKEFAKKTSTYYTVKFLNTGTLVLAEKRNIVNLHIADPYAKTIYNVACKGRASSRHPELNKIAFKRWIAMISRCYNQQDRGYNHYGAKGVKVSERWLCFENYLQDIQTIDGFDIIKYKTGEIQLDKDMKYINNKLYCLENCIFIKQSVNKQNQPSKMRDFIAISPENEVKHYNNINKCAKENNLTARTISKCLHNQLKQHKGWTFSYVV